MADKTTFIKLDRNIINWRWFTTPKILTVFIWLLIKANVKEGHFQKDIINRGSLVTSNAHVAEGCGITIANARTALANLEYTGEISRVSRNHYQIITINNYEAYQSAMTKSECQEQVQVYQSRYNNSQSTLIATNNNIRIKECKNERREKDKKKSRTSPPPPDGVGDVPNATKLKPIDEGTIDDIPEEYRDFCKTYAEYWGFRNR